MNGGQTVTVIECLIADGCDTIANGHGRQATTAMESLIADGCQPCKVSQFIKWCYIGVSFANSIASSSVSNTANVVLMNDFTPYFLTANWKGVFGFI